jgi:hypothetical protein
MISGSLQLEVQAFKTHRPRDVMMEKAPARSDADDDGSEERLARVARMCAWLTASGATGLGALRVGVSADGAGVFSGEAGVAPGGVIASVPASVALSVGASAAAAVGVACARLSPPPSPEFVLWLDMASGRRDGAHASHPYLAALPAVAPDCASWSEADREALAGTDVGAAVAAGAAALAAEHARVVPALDARHSVTLADLAWARGCYLSRRFPPRLLDAGAPRAGAPGVLLPFFDLLNHSGGTDIEWRGGGDAVVFVAGAAGVAAGAEVFNNYGDKANDELLVAHGFARRGNPHDRVGLVLNVAVEGGDARRLGPFFFLRGGAVPAPLWRALADPRSATSSSDSDASVPEVDVEAVELLLATLRARLAPFVASSAADAAAAADDGGRAASAAFYRLGQRDILEDAVAGLDTMLVGT